MVATDSIETRQSLIGTQQKHMNRSILFYIQRRHADAIYTGRKRFELRGVRITVRTGDRAFIYEPGSVSRVTGEFQVGRVVTGEPLRLTLLEGDASGHAAARSYLKEARIATAMEIIDPSRWKCKHTLGDVLPGGRPLESYVSITEQFDGLLRGSH
jgi:predicted transcriptional regulator